MFVYLNKIQAIITNTTVIPNAKVSAGFAFVSLGGTQTPFYITDFKYLDLSPHYCCKIQ